MFQLLIHPEIGGISLVILVIFVAAALILRNSPGGRYKGVENCDVWLFNLNG
jgi:hypothetical protein